VIASMTRLGRYRVNGILGSGGMAVVYLADNLAEDEEFRARFLREARLAARLNHPNIVQVFDIGEHDGRPFIVMEYVIGGTLAGERDRVGRLLAPARVADVARQCCAGLACAHAAGLVHRDVKPENVLVAAGGAVKISDFGIARAADEARLTLTGSILGTARYLAPEQAMGGAVTPAADVYSLGVVCYELLTGRPPHDGDTLTAIIAAKREPPAVTARMARPDVPPELDAAVTACLAPAPHDRPSAAQLAARLDGAPDAGPTRVMPAPTVQLANVATAKWPIDRNAKFPRPRIQRWRAAAAALLAAVAIVAVLALAASGSSAPKPAARPPAAPTGATPAQLAQHLTAWIRAHSR
jgi:serine/threonine-protein kinase